MLERVRLTRFEWGCLAVIAAAFVVRLTFLLEPVFIWDTAWYLMNSRAFLDTGTFLIRWSEPDNPIYSGYWPPLFPIFAAPFVKVIGPSYHAVVAAAIGASALLVACVFLMTRDMFGRTRAFAAAALIAASPAFYANDAKGMSESLLGLAVALTVWAFVKSLERPIWLPVAGVFAFLAYLGKASLGLPFVAAGILALGAWRVYTRGWRRVVRSPIDMGVAVAGLVGIAILALTRSERIGGIGLGAIDPLKRGFFQADCGELVGALTAQPAPFVHLGPHCWFLAFPLKVLFVSAFLFVVTLPLSMRLPQLLKQARTERTDALWLAVLLPIVAGAVFTTTFFFTEKREFVDFDNIRYLTPSLVPFVWLLVPLWTFEEEPSAKEERIRRLHVTWYWIAVGMLVTILLLNPLTGTQTLGRFFALCALALLAVVVSLYARSTQYGVQERRVGSAVERKFVRARQPSEGRRMAIVAGIVLIVGAWFYSAWYASVAFGLAVALATPAPSRRVVAFALILLASAAPSRFSSLPVDEAAVELAKLPEGTVVAMSEIVVYPAAVAPDNVEVRLFADPDGPIPEEYDVLLMQTDYSDREFDGFTRYRSWDYRFSFSPTMQARLWIEATFLGEEFTFVPKTGLTMYVRNATSPS